MNVILVSLFCQLSPPNSPQSPQPPPPQSNQWWEVLLDPPILIPILIAIVFSLFLFIFIFYYCNRERSQALTNVIDSVGIVASRIQGKKTTKDDDTIYIGGEPKKIKKPPSIVIK